MSLRLRIALTFFLLLFAVLAAALVAVSAANRANAQREVARQLDIGASVFANVLDANRRQLAQAAQVLALDFAFREAVATDDSETQMSALENHGARIGADLAVLVAPDGTVLASTWSGAVRSLRFTHPELLGAGATATGAIVTEGDRLYQLVIVPVRSPLVVAWVGMGFELDAAEVRGLAEVTGLDVTLVGDGTRASATTLPRESLAGVLAASATRAMRGPPGEHGWLARTVGLTADPSGPRAILSRSLETALAPFAQLTRTLVLIGLVALALAAVAMLWLARQITRPLHALAGVVERIRGGDYRVDVPVGSRDEIGALAEGLTLMQQAVDSRDRAIRDAAYTDALTGLRNRTAFATDVDALAAPPGMRIAVALVNLDRFRRINEALGYAAGDSILLAWAERLRHMPDLATGAARLAADHFALCRCVADESEARAWGAALLASVAEPAVFEGQPVDVRATVGIALDAPGSASADLLLRSADAAVERARRAKLDFALHDGTLDDAGRAQLSLWGELQRALDRSELQLWYQPKCRLADGAPVGAEALVRWQHPERGLVGPAAFLPFAEQTGFIRHITRWALGVAAREAARWADRGLSLPVSVNISAVDLADPTLVGHVRDVLARERLRPALLKLEITESGFIDDPQHALATLDALAELGVGLSIDDFGTGYSSLAYLARMPVDELKIDQSFIRALHQPDTAAVVQSAIELAQRLDLVVVAEGIEDAEVLRRLRELGCPVGQGWHYAKAMPAAAFDDWLAAHAVSRPSGSEEFAVALAGRGM